MVRSYTYLEMYLEDLHKQINLGEFEKYFKTPHQTIKKHLKPFVKSKVLIEEKKGRFRFYKLNLENPLTKEYILLCEKERLLNFLENNTLFSRLYEELSHFFHNSSFLIFGSSTTRKTYEDIDVLAISTNKHIKRILNNFEQTYSKKIHLIQTQEKNLTKTFIKEIKKKHIILNNHNYFSKVLYNELELVQESRIKINRTKQQLS